MSAHDLMALSGVVLAVFAFAWGACIGSFLNVCIHRVPRGRSVVAPRSHCPRCGTLIAWYDNIPLVSFFALRAKCRHCGLPISARYVVVEALTGALFLLVWLKFAYLPGARPLGLAPVYDAWLVPAYWLAVAGLLLAGFVDCGHMIIPDRVSLGGIAAGLALSPLLPELHGVHGRWEALIQAAIGAVAGAGLLYLVALVGKAIFKKDAMGLGDVKLLGAIGAFCGWPSVLFTILASSALGSVIGITLVVTGRKRMQSRLPYGPYLVAAAIVWILWGPAILRQYVFFITGRIG